MIGVPGPETDQEQPLLQLIEADDAGVCQDGYCHTPSHQVAIGGSLELVRDETSSAKTTAVPILHA